jgi:outer membrane immunogenic protein
VPTVRQFADDSENKKMKSLFAAALASLAIAAPAAAEVYGNVGYTFVDAQDVNLGAIGGKLGYKFNPYVGVEAEAAFGANDDTVRVGAVPVKVKLQNAAAAYVVGFYPATPKLDLFARVGYGTTKIKASALGASASGDSDGWNAGVGAQYFFTDKDGVRGEYTKWDVAGDNVDANTWAVSYVRKF